MRPTERPSGFDCFDIIYKLQLLLYQCFTVNRLQINMQTRMSMHVYFIDICTVNTDSELESNLNLWTWWTETWWIS